MELGLRQERTVGERSGALGHLGSETDLYVLPSCVVWMLSHVYYDPDSVLGMRVTVETESDADGGRSPSI